MEWAALTNNVQALQKLWEYAKENVTREEINIKLLLATDNEGSGTRQHRRTMYRHYKNYGSILKRT